MAEAKIVTLQNEAGEAVAPRTGAAAVSMASGETVEIAVDGHIGDTSNPHGVTKSQVGLAKVNNNTISMSLSGTTLTITYS